MASSDRGWRGWAGLVVVVLVVLAACGGQPPADVGNGEALDGQTLLEERCVQCHGLDRVTSQRMTEEAWRANVERMIGLGAQLNEAEKEVLVTYLAQEYGP